MLETESKEIDGRVYTYQPMMLKPARKLFDTLVQRFGPALADGVEGLKDAQLDSDTDNMGELLGGMAGSAASLMRGLVSGLDAKTHAELCDVIAKQMTVEMEDEEGGPVKNMRLDTVREMLFGKSLLLEFKVVWFGLQVQYDDFLEPMQNLAMSAMALRAKASESASQKVSIGTSTASPSAGSTAIA